MRSQMIRSSVSVGIAACALSLIPMSAFAQTDRSGRDHGDGRSASQVDHRDQRDQGRNRSDSARYDRSRSDDSRRNDSAGRGLDRSSNRGGYRDDSRQRSDGWRSDTRRDSDGWRGDDHRGGDAGHGWDRDRNRDRGGLSIDIGFGGGYVRDGYRDHDDWRAIADLSGGLAFLGALEGDDTLFFAGSAGALYSIYRYDDDLNAGDPVMRLRAAYFSRPFFYRDGHRFERVSVWRHGDRYFQFVRR